MNDELQRRLRDVPDDAPRSKLEPYREHILRWRRRGRTFRRIAEILRSECDVKVSIGTLHEFVQARARQEKPDPIAPPTVSLGNDLYAEARERMRRHKEEPAQQGKRKVFEVNDDDCLKPLEMLPRKSPEEIAAMREAARSSNHKPVFQPLEEAKPLFVYDPDRPLTNKPIRKD